MSELQKRLRYDKEYFDSIKKYAEYKWHLKRHLKIIQEYNHKTVLDIGCGHGYIVEKMVHHGIDAYGVDISIYAGELIPGRFFQWDATLGLPFKDKVFDLVISMDFFEHLYDNEINVTRDEMLRIGKNVISLISFKRNDYHLTVNPREWWEERLKGIRVL